MRNKPDPEGVNKKRHVVFVSGVSGAGKTAALKSFEDMGYEVVDNLPLSLLSQLVRPNGGAAFDLDLSLSRSLPPLAVGFDVRTRDFAVDMLVRILDQLMKEGEIDFSLLFLEADMAVLQRRFTETRRRHPLGHERLLDDAINLERSILAPLRERADHVLDTSDLTGADLKRWIQSSFKTEKDWPLQICLQSFSYKKGLPREADLVFDVRFLKNPYYETILRPLTGQDGPVGAFIEKDPNFNSFKENIKTLIAPLLPRYKAEGKSYLTIAIGCTGGRHRSVYTAEFLAKWIENSGYDVIVKHRELERAS